MEQQKQQYPRNQQDQQWLSRFNSLESFCKENGELPTKTTDQSLWNWFRWQKYAYRKNPNSPQWSWKIDMLARVGIHFPVDPNARIVQQEAEEEEAKSEEEEEEEEEEMEDNETPDIMTTIMQEVMMEQQQQQQQQQSPGPNQKWLSKYNSLESFLEESGGQTPTKKTNKFLWNWVRSQKQSIRRNPDSSDQSWKVDLFKRIGIHVDLDMDTRIQQQEQQQFHEEEEEMAAEQQQVPSNVTPGILLSKEDRWMQKWELLKEFLEENDGVRPTAKTNNNLYTWLMNQRSDYKRSPSKDQIFWKKRVAKLAELGIDITITATEEQEQLQMLLQEDTLELEYDNTEMEDRDTTTMTTIMDDVISEQQQQQQGAQGPSQQWLSKYSSLESFFTESGGQTPTQKTNKFLWNWVRSQKQAIRRNPDSPDQSWKVGLFAQVGIHLDTTQQQHLEEEEKTSSVAEQQSSNKEASIASSEEIEGGKGSGPHTKRWLDNYEKLKIFMEDNGVLPTKDTNSQLFHWLQHQRDNYKKSPEACGWAHKTDWEWKTEMLLSIGVDLTCLKADKGWMEKCELLKKFMEENGGVRPTAKTNNHLYAWLLNQRSEYRRSTCRDKIHWRRRVARLAELGIDVTITATEEKMTGERDGSNNMDQAYQPAAPSDYEIPPTAAASDEVDGDYDEARTGTVTSAATNDETTKRILDRFNFERRCCGNDWCSFQNIRNQRLPGYIERPLVANIFNYDNSTRDQRWESLSEWIVGRNKFQMDLRGGDVYVNGEKKEGEEDGTSVEMCSIALGRILGFNDHQRFYLKVLRVGLKDDLPDDPCQAEKERLIREYFTELEINLKAQYQQHKESAGSGSASTANKFAGKSFNAGYDEYCSFVASNKGQKVGTNFFSVYWSFHYPKLLERIGVTTTKRSKKRSSIPTTAGTSDGIYTFTGQQEKKRRLAFQGNLPRYLAAAGPFRGKGSTGSAIVVTRTPSATIRAKRRKAWMLRRRPVFTVR